MGKPRACLGTNGTPGPAVAPDLYPRSEIDFIAGRPWFVDAVTHTIDYTNLASVVAQSVLRVPPPLHSRTRISV